MSLQVGGSGCQQRFTSGEPALHLMAWFRAVKYLLPAVWTFLPMYLIERQADLYFLSDNLPGFYSISGWRLVLFIIIAVVGSISAGALLRQLWSAAIAEIVGLVGFLVAVYALCDPRVCYATGPEGLEPLRFGFFLGSVTIAGSALGATIRGKALSRLGHFVAGFSGFAAFGFFPVIFTFAGAKLLSPFHPWAAAILLGLASVTISVTVSLSLGPRLGFATPVLSLAALFALAAGIATAYINSVSAGITFYALMVIASAFVGAFLVGKDRPLAERHKSWFGGAFAIGLVLVLLIMLLIVPDAVNGVLPASAGSSGSLVMGAPVYLGAYMDAPAGHASGAEVTISFAGTNASSIQADNFLSAGIGIHAAGCCVDGIDYSYRFDLYLFHDGSEMLVASAWQVCDDNAACGGHSWKVLMLLDAEPFQETAPSDNISLRMEWAQIHSSASVLWTYSESRGPFVNFTSFVPPSSENHDFNTGVLPGGTPTAGQSGSYFFQFGVMSRYPIGHAGWTIALTCPAILNVRWTCVPHARTLAGDQSFWKVFWRWGEDYPNATDVSPQPDLLIFGFSSASSTPSFEGLW